jgi:hypothetical protein
MMGKLSRQREWQLKQVARGNCKICGSPRGKLSVALCYRCGQKMRIRMRKHTGSKRWKRGGRGRPPNSAKVLAGGMATRTP